VGKNNVLREIPFGKKMKKTLKTFYSLKEKVLLQSVKKDSYLFLSKREKPYTRQGLYKAFKEWCNKVQINPGLRFHSLRHRFATYLLNLDFNLAEVQRIMGHANIQTTARYLHFTEKTKQKIEALL
jgi:integrase/recombinase XerD